MIVGLGVDIAEINRIEAAIVRHGQPFIARLFTPAEIAYCEGFRHRYERYAGRFAVKEATMKALGTGWNRNVGWGEIEVVRQRGHAPTIKLSGKAAEFARKRGITGFHLSITHTVTTAMAHVIAEG